MASVTTFAEAILEPSVQFAWILGLYDGTTWYRFCSIETDGSGVHYRAGLKVDSPPTWGVNPWTGEAIAGNASVRLLPFPDEPGETNKKYPYSVDEIMNRPWYGFTAYLYRWCTATDPATQAHLELRGPIDSARVNGRGEVELRIIDESLKYDIQFPRYTLDGRVFSQSDAADRALGLPIHYGTTEGARGLRASMTGGTDVLVLGEAEMYYVSAVLAALVSQAGTMYHRDSTYGTRMTTYELVGCGDGEIRWWGTGIRDNAGGYFTSVPYGPINHILQQLHHLAVIFAEVPTANIDLVSLADLYSHRIAWNGCIAIRATETRRFWSIATEIAMLLGAFIGCERGPIVFRRQDFDRAADYNLFDGENVLAFEPGEMTPKSELMTRLNLKYRYGFTDTTLETFDEDYRASVCFRESECATFAATKAWLGGAGQPVEIETKMINQDSVALNVATRLADLHGWPRRLPTVTVGREFHLANIYQAVNLTSPRYPSATGLGCVNKKFLVTEITADLDTNRLKLIECAQALPRPD